MSGDIRDKVQRVMDEAEKYIFGQREMLNSIVAGLVCEGHLLIEGMPGLGKTMSISVMSKLMDLSFKRIQFTPDLLPSDLIGTMIYSQKKEEFSTKFGPVFTQILLADEINRSPPKVQAALLEAMAEKQVTIGENTHKLERPFVVLATQNPVDQEGTYPLPEAQLDRFMMKVFTDYPSFEAEKMILDIENKTIDSLESILMGNDITEIQAEVSSVYVDSKIKDLIIRLVQSTRPSTEEFPNNYKGAVVAGASPRASIWLFKISKFIAFLDGRDFVTPEDILKIVPGVIGHRMILSYEASIDKINPSQIALEIGQSLI